ncbi:MAG TPA: NAD(P)H-hydrate dehydratase [Polyangiaceae bacterium LLY-WYZ-15_(1-7)]|nr:bifunctional ADP-dependent NAD(P)H-hydrate dehydratase/NAD(P)H-hydrate epimerase [Myxococcales bacterium]MAT26587.1 bifunctional ADP-dependent NAD(P)H-hydrate dehydratase/NAD(P)H-hydrate epimerase [Sandaracinus sp.]HJL02528.1 NAD(P)H-hydrate dehydratase [Polyangiaceae bacterium LLY-WYZ-15_(1-7)]HJL11741.1 NAD(P)H-hydrate dehydratase [Polyangiaceae bacterium LLY-WYZ-15_(1-7)]HJL39306.1 NAD(P)H-hydrate dehydratase [Polyangiaceae bacterium LLY-WYZ-15_(1-7)]
MIPLLTRAAVRAVDAAAVEKGVAGLVLMENAGRGAAEALVERFPERLARVVCVGGPGQNGGDAWVVARHLRLRGHAPRAVVVAKDEAKIGGDARPNLDALRALGVEVEVVGPGLTPDLDDATLLVDGLFGTGLDRPIEGGFAELVEAMNRAAAPIVALDLPSGIDADTGRVLGVATRAALTVTFAAQKRGLHQHPGAGHAGEVRVAQIGVPLSVSSEAEAPAGLLEAADVAGWVAPRAADAHKGTAGHVLVVAGAPGKTGAAVLAGRGALRGGAGLVTIGTRAQAEVDAKVRELMSAPVADVQALAGESEGKAARVVGPGLGLDEAGRALAVVAGANGAMPTVLDADALTAWADEGLEGLREAAGPRVLTPHPGEAGRLLGSDAAAVQADRYAAASEIAARSGQVTVLKGAGTIVAHPDGRLRVCGEGTPALGVAGTGDVLAGVLGALLASGLDAFDAAAAGVWLHAKAGEHAAVADRGLLAGEVADALPAVLAGLR